MSLNQGGEWHCAFCRGKVRLSKLELAIYMVGSACVGAFLGVLSGALSVMIGGS